MEVSLRYPPVTGRLHTRYAPVRRSPPKYCYSVLPLDLHVLSLPLAFILSQDQTLHCKNCFVFTFLTRLCVLIHPLKVNSNTRYLFLLICFNVLSFPLENGCKDTTIFQTTKIFFRFFLIFPANSLIFTENFLELFFPLPSVARLLFAVFKTVLHVFGQF